MSQQVEIPGHLINKRSYKIDSAMAWVFTEVSATVCQLLVQRN